MGLQIINIYKQDLALNNLRMLTCHKTPPNLSSNISPNKWCQYTDPGSSLPDLLGGMDD